jgi:hypothetical protein
MGFYIKTVNYYILCTKLKTKDLLYVQNVTRWQRVTNSMGCGFATHAMWIKYHQCLVFINLFFENIRGD